MMIQVVGIQYRRRDVESFVAAVRKAEASGSLYGIRLEHQPHNQHDPNAIAVFGHAHVKGWFRSGIREWQVGFLDRETASEIVTDLVSRNIPIAGELYRIYVGDEGFTNIEKRRVPQLLLTPEMPDAAE